MTYSITEPRKLDMQLVDPETGEIVREVEDKHLQELGWHNERAEHGERHGLLRV